MHGSLPKEEKVENEKEGRKKEGRKASKRTVENVAGKKMREFRTKDMAGMG